MNLSQGNRMKKQIFHSPQNYSKYGFLPPWWSRRNICLHQDRNILAKNTFDKQILWIFDHLKFQFLMNLIFEKIKMPVRFWKGPGQRKHSNQPLHVFTIQPASLSSGRSPKSYFQISFQDVGRGNFHILNLFLADWVLGYKRVSQFECVLYEYYPSSILDGDQMCQAVENHQALSRKSTTQRKRKFKRWEWKGEC